MSEPDLNDLVPKLIALMPTTKS